MIVELSCDHDGCDVAYAPSPDEMTSVPRSRIGATVAGWLCLKGRDFCPEHATAAEPDEVKQIRELAGRMPDGRIAERLGMTRDKVQQLRTRYGIPGCKPGRPKGAWTPDKRTREVTA